MSQYIRNIEIMVFLRTMFVLSLMLFFSKTGAQDRDSLSTYLELAAANNPAIKAKYLEYSAALEKVPQAASLPDPEMQFGFFIRPMELLGGDQIADISLMQMFPWFGTLKAAKDEASKMAIAQFENFRNVKNELFLNVKTSYYKIYRTKKEIEIVDRNLELLQTIEQFALIKFKTSGGNPSSGSGAGMSSGGNKSSTVPSSTGGMGMTGQGGMAPGNAPGTSSSMASSSGSMGGEGKGDMVNLLRVQIEINELKNRIALLKDQLITDKASFNRYLSRSPEVDVFTGDSLIEVIQPENLMALADSLVNHPMVKMFEAESAANAAKIDMVTRMGYPMFGLGVNYSIIRERPENTSMMNGKDMVMPMISLTLPIYRKKYRAMRHEAEFLRDAATESATNVVNDLRVSLQQTVQNVNDADRRLELYSLQARLAEKSLELIIASFSASGSDFEEILRMEQQLLDYQFKQIEALVDKNTTIAQLIYLTGNY